MNNIKVAIVHDWLTGMRGGEKCLEVFCELFPDATVFTLLHNRGSVSPIIENMDIRTSFLQKMPGVSKLVDQESGKKYKMNSKGLEVKVPAGWGKIYKLIN